jgi:hypothetical protein
MHALLFYFLGYVVSFIIVNEILNMHMMVYFLLCF